MKKNIIPLSEMAKIDLWRKNFEGDWYTLVMIFSGMACLFLSMFAAAAANQIGLWIGVGVSSTIFILSFWRRILRNRRNKEQIIKENFKDWQNGQKILSIIDYLKDNPPNLKQVDSPGLIEIKKLTPMRIDYFPQSQIEGELHGTFSGRWRGLLFGSLSGDISGDIKGDSTPELTDQSAVAICSDEGGNSFRLIFPSSLVIRKNLSKYLQWLYGEIGKGSYAGGAVVQLWEEKLREIFLKLNAQRVVDYLSTILELPQEKRPIVRIKGIEVKEGTIIVFWINCKKTGSEVAVPIDTIDKIRLLLGEKINRKLPPVPLLGSGN